MGQYKLWLHYREIDQQLHTQLTQLTAQLDALKEEAQLLDEGLSLSENPIIQALLAQLVPATASQEAPETVSTTPVVPVTPAIPASERIPAPDQNTPPLPAFSPGRPGLLHLSSPRFFPLPSAIIPDTPRETKPAATPHPELDLLPEDITSFVDEHTQTAPLRTPPWWLHKASANAGASFGLLQDFKDQQSERTNDLVQRWLERWGRSTETPRPEDQQS